MTVKIRDLIAAEEALERAEQDFLRLNNPDEWSAWESVDKRGKRSLNVLPAHFERREAAMGRVEAARQQLLATKRAFLEGVMTNATG